MRRLAAALLHDAPEYVIGDMISPFKAAIGLGGAYGEGVVLKHDPATGRWYGPSFMNIAGASYGLQIGVQSTTLLLVITNQRGMERFYGDKVKLGADVDIAAGPVGRSVGAATDVNLKASIYSYSMSKGLFAGLSLSGAVMSTDNKANASYWGAKANTRDLLNRSASADRARVLSSFGSMSTSTSRPFGDGTGSVSSISSSVPSGARPNSNLVSAMMMPFSAASSRPRW